MNISNMHDAVQTIGRAVGLQDLAPNASGVFELVFGGQLPVYFQVVGEDVLEVQIRVNDNADRLTDEVMEALLQANLALAHGRIAVEPGSDRVVYCARLHAVGLAAARLTAEAAEAVREGTKFRMEGFAALLKGAVGRQEGSHVLSETAMRV